MKSSRATLLLFTSFMFIIIVVTTRFNYERLKMEAGFSSSGVGKLKNQQEFETVAEDVVNSAEEDVVNPAEVVVNPAEVVVNPVKPSTLDYLPRGIVEPTSDLELKELWNQKHVFQGSATKYNALLAVPVGLKQKSNVDIMVKKFSFSRQIAPLYFSTMMGMLMRGMILIGATK